MPRSSPIRSRLAMACVLVAGSGGCQPLTQTESPASPCPPYLGQAPPGERPRLFAPGVLSTGLDEREVSFSGDGQSLYYWVILSEGTTILSARCQDGVWRYPEVVPFAGPHMDFEPFLMPDEAQIYFGSSRPASDQEAPGNLDIWVVERGPEGFGAPQPLGAEINTPAIEFHPTLSRNGTLYFGRQHSPTGRSDVYRSRRAHGRFTPAQKLPEIINHPQRYVANALIAPDESYLLYTAHRPGGDPADADFRISFRQPDDRWSQPITIEPMGPARIDDSARLSPDGKFIFFSSQTLPPIHQNKVEHARPTMDSIHRQYLGEGRGGKNIYWISSSILDKLRAQAVFSEPHLAADQP